MGLKLLSNALTYNAMSSHLPLWFGQGAVFNMLLIVLAMQVPVRGMCCGSCSRGCKVGSKQISKGDAERFAFQHGTSNVDGLRN